MSARAVTQGVLRRMAGAAPDAWRTDKIFRWAAIGAGVTLVLFILRLVGPASPTSNTPRQTPSSSPSLGATYTSSLPPAGGPLSPAKPTEVPKIAPGRSLDSVTVTPDPHGDGFGTVKPGSRP